MSHLSKFLRKHSGELSTAATLFGTLLRILPIDPRDREAAEEAVESLHKSAASIKDSIAKVEKATDVKVSKADVKAAVEAIVPDLVAAAVAAALQSASEKN